MPAKILVVDDEVHLARIIQFTLEHEGYEVVTAFDGGEAMAVAERSRPNLVILDLMLPVIDGYRVCSLLHEREWFHGVPIIILTARDVGREHIDGPLDADLFMSKPFNTEDLISVVRELLERAAVSTVHPREA
jgi:two-component system response regulator VicR